MIEPSHEFTSTHELHFGQALVALPGQYLTILTRPGIKTFVAEKNKGSWGIVWFQLLLLAVIGALLTLLLYRITPPDVSSIAKASGANAQDLQNVLSISITISVLILTPISFFLANGILYLIAKLLRGKGTFLEQIYVSLLFGVPLVILSDLLSLIPVTSSWLPWLPHIYSIVLIILAMIAVHRREVA